MLGRQWLVAYNAGFERKCMEGGRNVDKTRLTGWLVEQSGLHHRRAPGGTCLSALESGGAGTMEKPINDSKGCGGVMRMAPVGLAKVDDCFKTGCELAAITHGHSSGYGAAVAGMFAAAASDQNGLGSGR